MYIFSKGIKKGIKNITKGIKWKMIGAAIKDMGKAIAYIAGSIIALALMYKNDADAFEVASKLVGVIGAFVLGAIALFSLIGQKLDKGMTAFGKAAVGIAALGLAIKLTVSAVGDLFSMTIPGDYEKRLWILAELFGGLAGLTIAVGGASRLAKGNKISTGPILALAAFLYISVKALEALFKMDLSEGWILKVGILELIFISLAGLMIAIGYAGKLAGGNVKATGTILAMCLFVGVGSYRANGFEYGSF